MRPSMIAGFDLWWAAEYRCLCREQTNYRNPMRKDMKEDKLFQSKKVEYFFESYLDVPKGVEGTSENEGCCYRSLLRTGQSRPIATGI
jgi:hypothetical protein